MRVVKHQDLKEFMLSLDHEEYADTMEVLVKYYGQYVYTARIIYESYSHCWRCLSSQTTRRPVRSGAFDHRTVRAYIEREAKPYQGVALGDINISDEECTLTAISSWDTSPSTADSFDTSPSIGQVLTWLSGSTGTS